MFDLLLGTGLRNRRAATTKYTR